MKCLHTAYLNEISELLWRAKSMKNFNFGIFCIYYVFLIFRTWQPLVTIYFHCMKRSSMNILLNILFCFPLKKNKKHTNLEQSSKLWQNRNFWWTITNNVYTSNYTIVIDILQGEGKKHVSRSSYYVFSHSIRLQCSDNPQNMWGALRRYQAVNSVSVYLQLGQKSTRVHLSDQMLTFIRQPSLWMSTWEFDLRIISKLDRAQECH